ncbi:MAG: hypothetical protein LBR37_00425 [Erysipelotrichaceae bacterium]|jgi:succinate dehydrogenase/fumarate reductase cytochrome b subunit|nr:hypothetical protein [Erysipelotrichaceae bacterium]
MEFLLELLFMVLVHLIVEPLAFLLSEKIQRKRKGIKSVRADINNFTVKYDTGTRVLVLVFGSFFGVMLLTMIIAFPFIYVNGEMSKTSLIISEIVLTIMMLVVIAVLYLLLSFKVIIREDKLYIYSFFVLKKYDVADLSTEETYSHDFNYRTLKVYCNNKKVFQLNSLMKNYQEANERLYKW